MYIVHVHCHVKAEYVDEFRQICIENARNSVQEPGCARFDVIQQVEDPTRFVLVEVYHTPEDPAHHRETAHYKVWAEAAPALLAEERTKVVFDNVFPGEDGWGPA